MAYQAGTSQVFRHNLITVNIVFVKLYIVVNYFRQLHYSCYQEKA